MKRWFTSLCLILGMLLAFGYVAEAQNKRVELEKEKKKLKKDIEYKNKLLNETAKSKSSSLGQLVVLRKKIKNREDLINAIEREIDYLEEQIEYAENNIVSLKEDLERLKKEYARMIYYAYLNKSSYDRLMFVFAAEDFNQAYKRLKYLQQYSEFRKRQGELILATQDSIQVRINELEATKSDKESLIKNIKDEAQLLASERQQQQSVFNQLSAKEKDLKAEISKKKKEADRLTKAIQRIIAEEIRKQREASGGTGGYMLTPEAKELSSKFASNRGKLPWPLEKGVITEYFGEHWHPVLKGIKVNNNGLNISTEDGARARAVFAGEVTGIVVIPGAGKAVLVRHGEYISVYSNLKDVFVQKGDKVDIKDPIGIILTDPVKGKTEIHFEVWKGQKPMNPAEWLYRAT